MKKLALAFFCTICAATAANAKIYWVSPSGNAFPGWQGVADADKTFTSLPKAMTDSELDDGDTVVLDKCEFAIKQSDWSGAGSGWEIKKAITLTGVGTREETIVSTDTNATKSAEVVEREWTNRFFPYFHLTAAGVKLQNMTFERLGSAKSAMISVDNKANCVISNLVVRNTGWGYYVDETKSPTGQGAMISGGNQNTVVSGCVITNNCWSGSIIRMHGSYSVVENCHIADNKYTGVAVNNNYGLFYFTGNYSKIRNNTIINNRTTGGTFNNACSYTDVANNIIRGNTLLDGTTMKNYWYLGNADALKRYVYNCLESDGSTVTGAGNIIADPLFKDDNYNLRSASPCKGAGSTAYAPTIDIDGVSRLDPPSIGCKEIIAVDPAFTVEIQSSAESVFEPATITFSAVVTGTYEGKLSYAWDFNGDGTIDSTEVSPVVSAVDSYSPTVVVSDESGAEKSATSTSTVIVYPANKTFYATPANVNARPPYATWETAGSFTDVHTLAAKIAGVTIVLDEGTFDVRESGYEIGNGMKVTSKSGRDKTIITTTGRIQGSKLFKLTDASSSVEGVTLTYTRGEAWTSGAAIYVSAGEVRDCQITNFFNKGTMVALTGTSANPARLDRTIIRGCSYNGTGNACAISVENYGYAVIENCLIAENVSPTASGGSFPATAINTSAASYSTIVRNCTIADNVGKDTAVPIKFMTKPTLFENNIVAGNTTNGTAVACNDISYYYYQYVKTNVESFVRNTCIYPADSTRDYSAVTNLITVAPGFVDAANGDYHLSTMSPCIGKGVKGAFTSESLDLDGNARIVGSKIDLGCYECQKVPGMILIVR